ncbi:YwaF family protein [Oceanivirga salmonicida]|uniref:YwaF family protein n=1 Tax=Oceanivirga salmonicida TaxID=1769291 RepID=UPI000830629D|nr:TIGR02206 family membrane protein [Oceanivirga salmonicida]
MKYEFSYFSKFHISLLLYALLLFSIFYIIHENLPENMIKNYSIIFGVVVLILKAYDSYNLYNTENYTLVRVLPFHACNVSLLCGAIYLINKNNTLFSVLYFLSFGAILALLFPDWKVYHTNYYPFIYYTTHMLEFIILAFGIKRLKAKVTRKNYIEVVYLLAILMSINIYINNHFNVNFMFLNDYAVDFLRVIKPFWLYRILVILTFYLAIWLVYKFTIKEKGEEINEKNLHTERI